MDLPLVATLADLVELVSVVPGLHLRFSAGPAADASGTSRDGESGLELPGLSANPLDAEAWWARPTEDWLARQIQQYAHLGRGDAFAWVLRGSIVGRGPDCEPLLLDVEPIARLSERVLDEAAELYRARFDAGALPGSADRRSA
ncbi:DUF6098 family protein [Schumannella soli]|uniref:Uncharacterized protein n=1 Tax=Schumannella soli TaxID=2590779 RepID=A0A506Y639_9MICO|nr:DUF6098 family protein [Schumannella soli]TPW77485.1 hypothetical protein FJ657_02040 [Schumannella soli]